MLNTYPYNTSLYNNYSILDIIPLTPEVIRGGTELNIDVNVSQNIALSNVEIYGQTEIDVNFGIMLVLKPEIIIGSTNMNIEPTILEDARRYGKRREVTYSMLVDRVSETKEDFITRRFRLFNLHYSLRDVDNTLDYVERTTTKELDRVMTGITSIPPWLNETSILRLRDYTSGVIKARVGANATSVFSGRDGQVGIYIGKILNEPNENEE